ncbi:MAG: pyridoxal phosphate-dependent aminotransferase family protein [Hyphomicrobiales bacterium]|nr:pyridoxal phosphate-dependent aminotransferase family protein [Hyphomicrobiales bacterium]
MRSFECAPLAAPCVSDFAAPDYLGLSRRAFLLQSAHAALDRPDPALHDVLTERLAAFAGAGVVRLFSSGAEAMQCALRHAAGDGQIVLDAGASPALQYAAGAATRAVTHYRHQDADSCRRMLADIRRSYSGPVVVAAEGFSPAFADAPKLAELSAACRRHDALLMVEASHDFGALGPDGRGAAGEQKALPLIDILTASFQPTFAAAGGFLAMRKGPAPQTSAFAETMSAPAIARALAALDMIDSIEGAKLRVALMRNAALLRDLLTLAGCAVAGQTAGVVSLRIGDETRALTLAALCAQRGLRLRAICAPDVARGDARLALSVSARHTEAELRNAADIVKAAIAAADDSNALAA